MAAQDVGNMRLNERDGVVYLTFPRLDTMPFLLHAFSTRLGGVSKNQFFSMNLNFNRGDSDENVRENYRRFCAAVGADPQGLVASAQDHHTFIRRVGSAQAGVGITRPRDMESVDGLCTDEPGITLVTYYADCVPLYFVDPERRAIGLAHSGWRGTAGRIAAKMTEKMALEFHSDPSRLVVAIGPSIGPCCYEIDAPVAERFFAMEELAPKDFMTEAGTGKFMLDLWECTRRVLIASGIRDENVHTARLCTKCRSELFFSHRVMGADRGGMAAMMGIRRGVEQL